MSGIKGVVRQSKVRHAYCQPEKREFCFDDVRVTRVTWDSFFCSVNPKFLAVIVEAGGGGAFLVLPCDKPGRVEKDHPLVAGHKAAVLDIQWCPFNDDVIASASEDSTVKIWQIPEGGVTTSITEPVVSLEHHERRVGQIQWHPTANNILMSVGGDSLIVIWNVGTGEALNVISCHTDTIFSAEFNFLGDKIVTTCKDRKLRVIDPRDGKILQEGKGHEGAKPARALFLKDGLIFTTGFSKMSERQYTLRKEECLGEPIHNVDLDTSNGILLPIYDPDLNMIYLAGKGDSAIRYFEVNMDQQPYIHYINTFSTSDPQRGLGCMPKRGLDITINEVMRFYKVLSNGLILPLKFVVPRKSDLFQKDLYPDTRGDAPALAADEWFNQKQNKELSMVSLQGGFQKKTATKLTVVKKSNVLDKMPSKGGADVVDGYETLVADIRMLKKHIIAQDKRIQLLEKHLGLAEGENGETYNNGAKNGTTNGS